MQRIRIFLDSSDYSVLSDANRQRSEVPGTLVRLNQLLADCSISFFYSGTLLSEIAPVDQGSSEAAERRADLLVGLCRRNAVISQDRLFSAELRLAHGLTDAKPNAHSSRGDWFPDGLAEILPIGDTEFASIFNDTTREMGLNRSLRRALKSKTFKGARRREDARIALASSARSRNLDDVLKTLPMRPQDARILARFAVGDATPLEAKSAFLESLRDPRWMMRWFREHHGKLGHFIEWTRKPSRTLLLSIEEIAKHAEKLRKIDSRLGTKFTEAVFTSARWREFQDDLLVSVAARMTNSLLGEAYPNLTAEQIDENCPGLAVTVRSLHSSWWSALQSQPRRPKASDFPDAIHAAYAPYVDVFRADKFMSPHIQQFVKASGTIVVPKLNGLVEAIESRSKANSP